MPGEPEWPEADVIRLRALWPDQAKSTAAIGREIGYSKAAVVGKAHRLGLPGRESPIKGRSASPRRERARRLAPGACTLPPLASLT